jgi:hypothetical protein
MLGIEGADNLCVALGILAELVIGRIFAIAVLIVIFPRQLKGQFEWGGSFGRLAASGGDGRVGLLDKDRDGLLLGDSAGFRIGRRVAIVHDLDVHIGADEPLGFIGIHSPEQTVIAGRDNLAGVIAS